MRERRASESANDCMGPLILLVEGQNKALSLSPLLAKKDYFFETIHVRRDALAWLEENSSDLVVVDARALRFNAQRFCQTLQEEGNSIPILLIPPAGEKDPQSTATMVLEGDVTPRRFLNRVKRLLPRPDGEMLRAGDLVLDIKHRVVSCRGQQHRLTPKQARLLEVLMRNPGRVLTRAFLMKEVWETSFVGDTRTLEVHVHWLRKAIEDDPSAPTYLLTVRRLGYRFKVPQSDAR
ncbi:MAG: response regulator transcription factor [Anaerolineae bacterium]|nr:response regulator transcription factor [Anaerolineae bacterium]